MKSLSTTGLLLASAAMALAAMLKGDGGFHWNWFYPWVLGPYVLLGLAFGVFAQVSRARLLAGRLAAALVLVFTCWMYIDAMWLSTSSTAALVFVFAPLYLLVGGLSGWAAIWALLAWQSRRSKH